MKTMQFGSPMHPKIDFNNQSAFLIGFMCRSFDLPVNCRFPWSCCVERSIESADLHADRNRTSSILLETSDETIIAIRAGSMRDGNGGVERDF